MGTRAQIAVYKSSTDKFENWEALTYHHWDGYPSNRGKLICDFLPDFIGRRGQDPEYMAARLLVFMCNADNEPNSLTGHGICKQLHGDIEYFYRIDPSGVYVYATHYANNPECWELLTSKEESAAMLEGKLPDRWCE